jgi:hypothetical protein
MLFTLLLLAADPGAASAGQGQTTTYTPRTDTASTDSAVPLDWAGPAARRPGADVAVQQFDPNVSVFGAAETMCVVVPGQPAPACAARTNEGLQIAGDIFSGSDNPDSTCQTIESTRIGADGKPNRVFATVCGDEAEAWAYRNRATPSSRTNPSRTGNRAIGPNDVSAPRSPRS